MAQYEPSEALKEKLGKAESMEDVVRAFSEEGIEVSAEQLEVMLNQVTSADGEISEEALDHVSGGAHLFPLFHTFPAPSLSRFLARSRTPVQSLANLSNGGLRVLELPRGI